MLNTIGETVTKPWRDPMPIQTLLLWIGILIVVAWVLYDALRILSGWVASVAE